MEQSLSGAIRPEIAANEEMHRQRIQIATTTPRASIVSGRDVLDPTPVERTALAIADFQSRSIALDAAQ